MYGIVCICMKMHIWWLAKIARGFKTRRIVLFMPLLLSFFPQGLTEVMVVLDFRRSVIQPPAWRRTVSNTRSGQLWLWLLEAQPLLWKEMSPNPLGNLFQVCATLLVQFFFFLNVQTESPSYARKDCFFQEKFTFFHGLFYWNQRKR